MQTIPSKSCFQKKILAHSKVEITEGLCGFLYVVVMKSLAIRVATKCHPQSLYLVFQDHAGFPRKIDVMIGP